MFDRIQTAEISELLIRQAPPFAVSLAVADQFFHFGRFAPECLAFVGLWYAVDRAWGWVLDRRGK